MTSAKFPERVLLLDLDGTLAASVGVLTEVYHRFLEARGRIGTPEEFARLNGPSLEIVSRCDGKHSVSQIIGELQLLYSKAEPHKVEQEGPGDRPGVHGIPEEVGQVQIIADDFDELPDDLREAFGMNEP